MSITRDLREASTYLFEWERIPAMPQLTGIPPHVLIFIEFHKLEVHYENIIQHVDENPARTLNLIRDHLDSRQNSNLGVNLQAVLDDKFSRLAEQIMRSHTAQEEQESNENGEDEDQKWTLFSWQDGSTHVLPENFKFPNTKMSEMIELWLLGNKEKNISP